VLHPARTWIVLRDLGIALAEDLSVRADGDRGRAGRTGVEA
jgi:hypothetical protein